MTKAQSYQPLTTATTADAYYKSGTSIAVLTQDTERSSSRRGFDHQEEEIKVAPQSRLRDAHLRES